MKSFFSSTLMAVLLISSLAHTAETVPPPAEPPKGEELPVPTATPKKRVEEVIPRPQDTPSTTTNKNPAKITPRKDTVYVMPVQTSDDVHEKVAIFKNGTSRLRNMYAGLARIRFQNSYGQWSQLQNDRGHTIAAAKLAVCRTQDDVETLVVDFANVLASLQQLLLKALQDRLALGISADSEITRLTAILVCNQKGRSAETMVALLDNAYNQLVRNNWNDRFHNLVAAAELLN